MGKDKHHYNNSASNSELDGEPEEKYQGFTEDECCHEDGCDCKQGGDGCQSNDVEEHGNANCDKTSNGNKEQEYLELAQRLKAEFDNYKKRTESIVSSSYQNGVSGAVSKLLPVLDSFKQAKEKIADESTLVGVELIYNQLITALSELGVKKIECVGKQFDPNFHNAVLTDSKDDIDDGIVLEEFQEGFTLGDKVIRHSVVKINKLNY